MADPMNVVKKKNRRGRRGKKNPAGGAGGAQGGDNDNDDEEDVEEEEAEEADEAEEGSDDDLMTALNDRFTAVKVTVYYHRKFKVLLFITITRSV